MVFWCSALFGNLNPNRIYNPGPTKFWRRRRILRMSAHYRGRKRNCWRLAIRTVHKALVYATKARKIKSEDLLRLRKSRVSSAAEELGISLFVMRQGLQGSNICLNNRSLTDLAIWEPRTFQSLTNFAWKNFVTQGFGDIRHLGSPPDGVILRGLKPLRRR